MKRPILIVVMGYILGIIWGQYFKISIALLYILITIIFIFYSINLKRYRKFKLISIHRYFRYLKIFFNLKIIILICISSCISCQVIQNINKSREKVQKNYAEQQKVLVIGKIVSSKKEEDYKTKYEMEIKYENKKYKVYIDIKNYGKSNINKNDKFNSFEYGDILKIEGKFVLPEIQRNFYGFDYNEYLKQKNIIGTITMENYSILKSNKKSLYTKFQNCISKIKTEIYKLLTKDVASIFIGIVIGDKTNIEENIIQNFKNSSLSHVLAVSGMNISFLIMGVAGFNKLIGKRKGYFISIFVIIIYILITGFSTSIYRAGIMGILMLLSKVIYRKSDIWVNISTSLLFLLILNPFLLFDIGLQLSYGGTIGIILFQEIIFKNLEKCLYKIKKVRYLRSKIKKFFIIKSLEIISVTISAQIAIMPILIYQFHSFSTYFLISNFLVSILIEPLFILSLIFLLSLFVFKPLAYFIVIFIEAGYNLLIKISNIGNLPKAQILLTRPYIILIIAYIIACIIFLIYNKLKNNKERILIYQRFKNLKAWGIYNIKLKKKMIILIMILTIIFYNIPIYTNLQKLKIYFIDVGQGDSSLIITQKNKKILIDGGGSEFSDFDVGEKTLLPYLLNRRIKELDMVVISHFDQDHVRRNSNNIRKCKS